MFCLIEKILILLCCFPVFSIAESHSVPFSVINGMIVIEASIDNEKGLFILDTGADDVILNGELGGKRKTQVFNTVSGGFVSEESDMEEVSIGKLTLKHKKSFTANLENLESWLGIKLKGILGAQVFTPNVISIDYQSRELVIASDISEVKTRFYNKNKIRSVKGVLLVEVNIDNKVHQFILDSGATSHFIDVETCQSNSTQYQLMDEKVNIKTADSLLEVKNVIQLKRASIGSTPLANNRYIVSDLSSLSHSLDRKVDGLLSLAKLSKEGFLIDLKNKVLYL